MSQATINVRMDQELKSEVESVCRDMGMNMTTAFIIFAKRLVRDRAIPFEVSAGTVEMRLPKDYPLFSTMEDLSVKLEEGARALDKGHVRSWDEVYSELAATYGV